MNTKIHVCILTTAHAVDDVRVNSKFAHAFREAGFRVSWVGPGHAFFDETDYNRDDIQFLLAPPIHSHLDRLLAVRRIRNLAASVTNVDVYYAPDPDSSPLALHLARQNGAKVIFDIHEIYHGTLLDRWLLGRRFPLIRNYVRQRIAKTCSRCDLVVGVSEAVLSPYVTPGTRHMVVRSCAPAWFAQGPASEVCGENQSTLTIMHGKGDLQRGTLQVMEALGKVAREISGLRVIIFTQGDATNDPVTQIIKSRAHDLGIPDVVDLRKGITMQQMPAVLRSCDVGLIAYGRGLGVDSLPNRLFEYMAVGLPIIAPSYAVEIAKIIEAEGCGLLADFEDPASVAEAILKLHRNPNLCRQMGQRAREAFEGRYNWEVELRPLLDRIISWFPDKR